MVAAEEGAALRPVEGQATPGVAEVTLAAAFQVAVAIRVAAVAIRAREAAGGLATLVGAATPREAAILVDSLAAPTPAERGAVMGV